MPGTTISDAGATAGIAAYQLDDLLERFERLEADNRATSAGRLVNLARLALERAALICHDTAQPLDSDTDDLLHLTMSKIDGHGPSGYLVAESTPAALLSILFSPLDTLTGANR